MTWNVWRGPLLTIALLVCLLIVGFGTPAVVRAAGSDSLVARVLETLQRREMNREAREQLMAGYYEGLLNEGTRLSGMTRFLTRHRSRTQNWSRPDRRYRGDFLFYDLKPNARIADNLVPELTRVTNSFGMADQEYTLEKPEGVRRIVLLGDSVTRGGGAPFGTAYEARLEEHLNARHAGGAVAGFEILNLAVDGYRVTQLVEVSVERAPQFDPDVYMVALTELSVFRRWSDHLATLVQNGVDLKYDYLKRLVAQAGVTPRDPVHTVNAKLARYRLDTLRWALGRIAEQATADGAALIVLIVPTVWDLDVLEDEFTGVREAVRDLGLPMVDILDTFSEVDHQLVRVAERDRHPNAEGYARGGRVRVT